MSLTEKQQKILDYIKKQIQENGYPPTIREIGEKFSLSSTGSVRDHLKVLSDKKYIERLPGISRGIRLQDKPLQSSSTSIPVVGRITAGKPELAIEDIEGTICIDKKLVDKGTTFALKVKGDSMIDAGIQEGDYVIVKPQNVCEQGEIIIALIEGEATVKRFKRKGNNLFLQPANPSYEPIKIDERVKIIGKVVGLIRYYN
ncbi:transcriptional repressor LexA [bacterium]|nr:transcriptional repressor LexA [bacterium]